jgi:tRNA(Arg) A34 adenosine deaminase TadA
MAGGTEAASQADKEAFMRRAIEVAYEGMNGGHGGPFGAVVVCGGRIVGEGHNRVLSSNDPTAHAEVTAIRAASAALERFDLSDCEIYVNGLPCPMCMAAIFWSRIGALYYACLPEDAEAIGFDDQEFYRELEKPVGERALRAEQVASCYDEARACYDAWLVRENRTPY